MKNQMIDVGADYQKQLKHFFSSIKNFKSDSIYPHNNEIFFESLHDWSLFHSLDDVRKWFISIREKSTMKVTEIPINEMKGWSVDKVSGNIKHSSGDFFYIHGVRVSSDLREREKGWDQPIIQQIGYDGGLLGIIRKRFHGVPHYLCEAKEEPGNYGKVQISPTLQATYANLNQSHGGRKPRFAELFLSRDSDSKITVLFDNWLAEDGGRLHLKRNRGILIEVDESYDVELPNNNFIWLSLYQIKTLMNENAWVNPHIRGILAHV